ncbi:glycosyltransferase family 39 protein [Sphingomonas donggukensis]|uniref:Glycosyltransferase family 39 protein n=1 Tax=Sphingomonas donggukensis TaxID=2949093 RepID=A0ABY4TYA7_9SPHN|nr:glycosyltransferase family 39 protein [Sphingomonas donggukensis]URW76636.1 glycosyltransferase family 39 protein [Sphingomonas donggukensis]
MPAHRIPFLPLSIAVIAALGLGVRIASAHGALWLDEAWSAAFARDVATPVGVFVGINHDNNHHLNTLWLQLVGWDAAPVVQRALSIATGTLAILVAAAIGMRRSAGTGLVTAALFAFSPMLVIYGSEARGYAPMMLALLVAVLIVERWLEDRKRPAPAIGLSVAVLLGILSQMTMVFALPALAGWAAWQCWRDDRASAIRDTARLMALPVATAALAALAILRWLPGAHGFQFGAYQPYALIDQARGLTDMIAYTLALPVNPVAAILVGMAAAWMVVRSPKAAQSPFHALAIFGLPLAIALLHIGNAGMSRYYLLSSVALLLMLGNALGGALIAGGRRRWVALALMVGFGIGAMAYAIDLVGNRRGDPARAIATIARSSPAGAAIALDRPRASAVIEAAAAARRYPVRVLPCGDWLFVDRDGDEPFPDRPRRCGVTFHAVASGHPSGLSGTHWTLYERRP